MVEWKVYGLHKNVRFPISRKNGSVVPAHYMNGWIDELNLEGVHVICMYKHTESDYTLVYCHSWLPTHGCPHRCVWIILEGPESTLHLGTAQTCPQLVEAVWAL